MTAPETPRRRLWPVPVAAVGVAVIVAGAVLATQRLNGEAAAGPGPQAATTASASAAATQPAPSPTPGPMAKGKVYTFDGGRMTTTVLKYKLPAGTADDVTSAIKAGVLPKGGTYGAIEVKTCLLSGKPVSVSSGPWSLDLADDTTTGEKWSGVVQPEYPFYDKTLNPGKCVRGWIVFTVPGKARPTVAVYEGGGNQGEPAEWELT